VRPALAFVLALAAGEAVALPSAHLAFRRPRAEIVASSGVAPMADALAASQLAIWQGDVDGALAKARGANPEWDLMHRTFFAIALANLAEREPTRRAAYVPVVDRILTDTRAAVATNGATTFLLPYAHAPPVDRSGAEVALRRSGARPPARRSAGHGAGRRARVRARAP
jgi:hypothetical protein